MGAFDQYDLGSFDEAFQQAPAAQTYGREEPPDGAYECQVDEFDVFPGRKDPNAVFLKTKMHVCTGEHAGVVFSTLHQLNNPDKMGFLKKHLYGMGVEEMNSLSELEDLLPTLLDIYVLVEVKTNGQYVNSYVNERLSAPVGQADDLPFS